jgi:hypothetical protein
LCNVPATAIAAALPRLHTLHVDHRLPHGDFQVAPFYDELLPRLRSFHLEGKWPQTREGTEAANMPPLRLLEDLEWHGRDAKLPCRFMGARPSTLNTSVEDLAAWLHAADGVGADSATVTSPLARVRALTIRLDGPLPVGAFMARLLRAAPHLRQLTFYAYEWPDVRWVFSDAFTSVPARTGVAHAQLRHVAITSSQDTALDGPVPDGCGVRLRQRHFPRLRRLTVKDEEYPVV